MASNIFALENFETGTTVSIDEFTIELPSESSFPKVNDSCSELVMHGDAENTDGQGWAFYPMWSSRSYSWEPTITEEKLSNGAVNKFYRAANRRWHSDTIKFSMVNGCFVKAISYWISVRVRVSSEEPLSYNVRLEGKRYEDGGWTRKDGKPYHKIDFVCLNKTFSNVLSMSALVLFCPPQTRDDGWVTCSGPYTVEEDFDFTVIESDIVFNIFMNYHVDNGPDEWAVVDYDDLSVSFMSGVSTYTFAKITYECTRDVLFLND